MKIQGCIVRVLVVLLALTFITGCEQTSSPTLPPAQQSPKSSATEAPATLPNIAPTSVTVKPPSLAGALGIQESVDMRGNDGPIMSQFGGTCSTFATAAAMNNLLNAKGIKKLISERHLWSLYGQYDADAAVQAANENFVTEEKYWPVDGSPSPDYRDYATHKITQFKNHDYNMESALQGLSQHHPLVMAVQVPSGLSNCDAMVSPSSTRTSGEHVIEAVGYKLDDSVAGGGYFIIKNSWGPDCGDKGYHYYPFSLCKRSDLYCYFIEIANVQ